MPGSRCRSSLGDNQMAKLISSSMKFADDESGATIVEYGLIVGLIAMIAVAAVTALGLVVPSSYEDAAAALN